MVHANDNDKAISGKAAHAWPAMTRAKREDRSDMAIVLHRFAKLYETAHKPAEAIPSVSGTITRDAIDAALLGDIDLVEDCQQQSELPDGFGIDRYVDFGPSPEKLAKLTTDDFRVTNIWRDQIVDGEITRTFRSFAEYRDKGRWYRYNDRFRKARRRTKTANPLREGRSIEASMPAEERLCAIQELESLRKQIGDEAFEVLQMAAVDRSTAQRIGEARGKKYKPASALGGKLLEEAINAANDNWKLAETA